MFVSDKTFQPSLIFMGKAGAYPNEALFSCFTLPKRFRKNEIFFKQSDCTLSFYVAFKFGQMFQANLIFFAIKMLLLIALAI